MFLPSKTFPHWVYLSLAANGLLLLAVIFLLSNYRLSRPAAQASPYSNQISLISNKRSEKPNLGIRHHLNYEQWIALLGQEAEVIAAKRPQRLTVLVGDSLSLWFPTHLLPPQRDWLNQGISGETSAGLLRRLELFDHTNPKTIFVMIGINDLIRGVKDEKIVNNQKLIVQYLQRVHPNSQIVVQSILPHGGENSTWEGRDRLLAIANQRIIKINRKLAAIASDEGVRYLDLYPLFADEKGDLRAELTTDGLHLSPQGYLVWRSALQLFSKLKLE